MSILLLVTTIAINVVLTFLSVYIASKIVSFEISISRMVLAAICCTLLGMIPMPFSSVLGVVGLFVCLNDTSYEFSTFIKFFILTVVFSILARLGLAFILEWAGG